MMYVFAMIIVVLMGELVGVAALSVSSITSALWSSSHLVEPGAGAVPCLICPGPAALEQT